MPPTQRQGATPSQARAPYTPAQALRRAFYARGAETVAQALLGCVLVRRVGRALLAGRIVETEAYLGERDRASHASRGPTPRNAPMYGSPGHAYVYFIYGMYDMLNVVCGRRGVPHAVLIRAVEPVRGVELMLRRRGVRRVHEVASGPGKLCRAFSITRTHNQLDLTRAADRTASLWIERGRLSRTESVEKSPRVGVDYAGADASLPLRFFVAGNVHVSRTRPARVRRPLRA